MKRALLISCMLALAAGSVFAESQGGGHSALPWKEILKQAINFGILVGILVYFLRKPLSNFLKERRELLIKSMEDAKRANDEAREKLAAMEEKLASIDKEVEALNFKMEEESASEIERIKALTRDEIRRIKEQASFSADQEVKKARQELRDEAAGLSIESAKKIIEASLTDEDQKKFVRDSMEKIKGESN